MGSQRSLFTHSPRWNEMRELTAPLSELSVTPAGGDIGDLTFIDSLDDCGLSGVALPAGWDIGQVDSPVPLPILRIALFRVRDDQPWIACETLTGARLTGQALRESAAQRCEGALRGLAAEGVVTSPLAGRSPQTRIGARGNGYFNLAGRRLWIQCSTYMKEPSSTRPGLLIEQVVFVDAKNRAWLRDDIDQLTDELHAAVLHAFDTVACDRVPEEGSCYGS